MFGTHVVAVRAELCISKKREKEPWSFFIWEILENVTISSISQEKYCTSAGVKESWDLEKFASVYV